jgi:hypothetical protein
MEVKIFRENFSHQNFGRVVMLLGGLCENLESIHETEDEICHKGIQTALLSFL